MAKIVIFGAGDIAKLAHHYFTTDSEHEVVAFTVDHAYRESDEMLGLPVVDFEQVRELYPPRAFGMFIGLSYTQLNRARAEKYHAAKELGYSLVSYISSRCSFLTQFA